MAEYPSAFALVNHAIEVAKRRIGAGRVPDVYSENQNLAFEVLEDILENREDEEEPVQELAYALEVVEIPEEEEIKPEKPKRQEFKRVAPRKVRPVKAEDLD